MPLSPANCAKGLFRFEHTPGSRKGTNLLFLIRRENSDLLVGYV